MQKIFRTLLIVAMLMTSYLLVLAWQKDYGGTNPKVVSTPQIHAQNGSIDLPAGDLPTAHSSQGSLQNLIDVTTDLYHIKINPVGGDVVYAALRQYQESLGNQKPFVLLEESGGRTYTAQSLIGGKDGIDNAGRVLYQSPQSSYVMTQDTLSVPLSYQKDGVLVQKTYVFKKGDYPITLNHTIVNHSAKDWQGELFVQLKRDNSKDPGLADKGMMGLATYLGGAWGTLEQPYNKLKFSKFNDHALNQTTQHGWVAMVQHYFVSAWTPSGHVGQLFSRANAEGNYIGYRTRIDVASGRQIALSDTLYVGPKVQDQLASVATGLDKTVDYGVLWPISKPMFMLLQALHGLLGNWGWSIIVLTLLVKTALSWLSAKGYYSMAKMRMIAPKLEELKQKHGDDRMAMSQAMMALYREEKVNPMAGCLPIVLQMPIFLGLYWCLVESVELRHAPWILWIKDLSAMDPWFVLPIFMGITMYVQQQFNPQPADPMQAKVMKFLPIVFAAFMLFFPAGLVLYWTVNNLFSMAQQQYINKKVEKLYKAQA